MIGSEMPESDTFNPLRIYGIVFEVLGWLIVAGGLFTVVFGFQLGRVEYSGLIPGLGFILPGLAVLGLGRLMSAVAIIGNISQATLLRAERLVADAKAEAATKRVPPASRP